MLDEARTPVSWWLFFPDGPAAGRCAAELDRQDFLTLVEHRPDIVHRDEKWLVRAARPFLAGCFQEERRLVSAAARSHGGVNEGMDSGWLRSADDLAAFQHAISG